MKEKHGFHQIAGKTDEMYCILYLDTIYINMYIYCMCLSVAMTVKLLKIKQHFSLKHAHIHIHTHPSGVYPHMLFRHLTWAVKREMPPPPPSSVLWELLQLQIIPWWRRPNCFKNNDGILIWYLQQHMSSVACLWFFPVCVCICVLCVGDCCATSLCVALVMRGRPFVWLA